VVFRERDDGVGIENRRNHLESVMEQKVEELERLVALVDEYRTADQSMAMENYWVAYHYSLGLDMIRIHTFEVRHDDEVGQMDGSNIAETWQSADEYKYTRQIICATFPIALFDLTNEEEEEGEERKRMVEGERMQCTWC
jgi:hypothetical protein